MRNRVFKAMCKVPMNLQLFAEGGDGAGAGEGNGGGSGEGTGSEGGDNPPSFDDFLKTGGNQAEFDRRVQKAVNTAVTNAQEKWQALTDDKLSEADIKINNGKDSGQEKGGYEKGTSAKNLNFFICPVTTPIAVTKQDIMRIFDPTTNQKLNAWQMDYRRFHDMWILDNKLDSIYLSIQEAKA